MPKKLIQVTFCGPGDRHLVKLLAVATETDEPDVYAIDPDSIVLDMRENGVPPSIGPTFQIEDV